MTADPASTAQTSTAPASAPTPAPAAAPPASPETPAHAGGDGTSKTTPQQADSLPKGDSKGANDSKGTSEDPAKTRHARAYAKATGKWPAGHTPSKADLEAVGNKSSPDAEQPGTKKRSPGGGGETGTPPPTPGTDASATPDHASSLRAQYAEAGDEEGIKLHAADAELRRNGYTDARLMRLDPADRLDLAASSLKRVEGFRRALGSQKAPSDTATRPDAAGRQTPANPSAKPANATPGHITPELAEQMRDSYVFLEPAAQAAANAALDAMLAAQARGVQPKGPGQNPADGTETETNGSLQFTPDEMELAQGNLEWAQQVVAKDFPWITSPEAFQRVVKHAERLAKADGEDDKVLLRGKKLLALISDAAAMVSAKEIKQSKNAAAAQAKTNLNGATLSGPKPSSTAPKARELTQQERSQTALRAAKDSRGDPELNAKLLKQYREELTAQTL